MRDFLNTILSFIGAASLSDDEFSSVDEDLDTSEEQDVYDTLLVILNDRGSVTDAANRLRYYYLAKGVDFSEGNGSSNILVGGGLCN